ncbi:uncharacterized protein FOMMEDRAFT_110545 [Fomitiporia mediterranea MF3/22]|uniref:uncharacterized protein n=1 Tax=Fomitiporia mediterranea (strain MF3/22) TaxID=694068 RepID=UPI0004408043|nr:uncharacterized protein FOMMEDRAFT_110545 [Fomitiporia mediterranea MF3/22]EJD01042.1 hypothetical protein FOMMEDRAFT_110545 [Fomitiporia mediterranea MF3/22]
MVRTTIVRLTTGQRRSFISSLFTATFFASIITVAASQILPCPAQKRRAEFYAGGDGSSSSSSSSTSDAWTNVPTRRTGERKPRRWIEEKTPGE